MLSRAQNEISAHTRPLTAALPGLAAEPGRIHALAKRVCEAVGRDAFLRRVLIGLLLVDLAFIAANLIAMALFLSPKLQGMVDIDLSIVLTPAFSVNADQGLAEIFDYGKIAATVVLLYLCGRRHAQPIYLAGAVAFLIILLDDSLMIHETVGAWLASRYDLPFAYGLRPEDFGELSVYAVWMLVAGALGLYGLAASRVEHIRAAMLFVAVIGVIAFFSVLVDMAEIAIYWQFRRAALMIGVIEDGGEMIGMTLALVLALTLWRRPSLVAETPPKA